jgi:hypothetical protein
MEILTRIMQRGRRNERIIDKRRHLRERVERKIQYLPDIEIFENVVIFSRRISAFRVDNLSQGHVHVYKVWLGISATHADHRNSGKLLVRKTTDILFVGSVIGPCILSSTLMQGNPEPTVLN